MKAIFSSLLLAFTCTSCVLYSPYFNDNADQDRLTDLRFQPQEEEIDLYFIQESKPARDYIRLAMFNGRTTEMTGSALLTDMKERARNLGANALLILGNSSSDVVVNDFDFTYTIPQESISALAIRYTDDIEFAENILSHWTITPGDTSSARVDTLRFYQDGELISRPKGRLSRTAYYHSTLFLLETTQDWEFAPIYQSTAVPGLRRRKRVGTTVIHEVKIVNRSRQQIDHVVLRSAAGRLLNERIVFVYDEQNRITNRQWEDMLGVAHRVERTYNEDGSIGQERFFKRHPQEKEVLHFTVDYHYYGPESWQLLLDEAQVVKAE